MNWPAALQALHEDAARGDDVVWDRSWASDWVYGVLLGDGREIDPALREEMYHPFVDHRIILTGPGGEAQFGIRTADDQPVDPHTERELYRVYGKRWGWQVLENEHTEASLADLLWITRTLRDLHQAVKTQQNWRVTG